MISEPSFYLEEVIAKIICSDLRDLILAAVIRCYSYARTHYIESGIG